MTLTTNQLEALNILKQFIRPGDLGTYKINQPRSLTDFAQNEFYIPETSQPIQLLPHQISILNYALDPNNDFQTIVYSTVKKSGKTAIASLVARWIVETWGPHVEVYLCANDLEQARGRVYQKAVESIELNPNYNRTRRELSDRWRIIEREAKYLPTNSILRAISSDYKGEAGSNPTATFWSELWGYSSAASHRLWDELTPVPTRARSIRWVETYAGFENESDLLIQLYQLIMKGTRLTHNDINWPFEDQPPLYVNKRAKMFAYWDSGEVARRMPWQTKDYYDAQAAVLRPEAFERLHLNYWTSGTSQFLPVEWWDACEDKTAIIPQKTPIVLGVDAAVSSDCAAITGVSRYKGTDVVQRILHLWKPEGGNKLDYTLTIEPTLRMLCKQYNVVEIAYDPYQLHDMMTRFSHEAIAWCRPFSQGTDRLKADKQLYDLIRDRRIHHNGFPEMREHILNCAAKLDKDDDSKLRIIKKSESAKVDAVIATSMATAECLRLNL